MGAQSLGDLRTSLFWDVNPKRLDVEKDYQFIIGRVFDFGNIKEWKLIEQLYGREKISDVAKSHIFIDRRNTNFWALILSIPINQLKCTRRPLLKTPNAFSNH